MAGPRNHKDPSQQPRRDSTYEQHVDDPYLARGKLKEPTACPDCGAVFRNGRWQWSAAPAGAHSHRCPACSRIHDKAPAAQLTLSGEFYRGHRDEIMSLVHNTEEKEKQEHPLERIMAVDEATNEPGVVISYTGIHLAKSTGNAVHHAYQGQFEFEYTDRDSVLRLSWQR